MSHNDMIADIMSRVPYTFYRSSITGYIVTEEYARKHPHTTQKESGWR